MEIIYTLSILFFSFTTIFIKKKFRYYLELTGILLILILPIQTLYAQNTTSWTNSSGGDWNTASNWSNGVPTSTSDVIINLSGTYTITVNNYTTVNSLTLGTTGTGIQTIILNNTINLQKGSNILKSGKVNLTSGSINGPGSLTNEGTIICSGTALKTLNDTIYNYSVFNIKNSTRVYYPLLNELGSTIDILDNANISSGYGGKLINNGLFLKSKGTGTATISSVLINNDSIVVNSGNLQITSGNVYLHAGTYYAALGDSLIFNSSAGNVFVKGTLSGNPDGTILDESHLFTADSTEAVLNFNRTGFKWRTDVFTQRGGGNWVNTGLFYTVGQNEKLVDCKFENQNLIEMDGPVQSRSNFINQSGAVFKIMDGVELSSAYTGAFTNKGLLIKSTGTGTATVSGTLINEDSIVVDSGNLQITSGNAYLNGGTYYTAAGDSLIFNNSGGNVYVKGRISGSPAGAIIDKSHYFIADSTKAVLDFSGTGFQFSSGWFSQRGGGKWANNKILNAITQEQKIINSEFDNKEIFEMNGSVSVYGAFKNEPGAKFNINADANLSSGYSGTFTNQGYFSKNGGTGTSIVNCFFINEDSVSINSGNLKFTGLHPNFTYLYGGTFGVLKGDSLIFASDETIVKGKVSGDPEGSVIFTGNKILADTTDAVLNFGGTGFQWVSGSFDRLATGNWTNQGMLYLNGPKTKSINYPTGIVNNGTIKINSPIIIGWHHLFDNESNGTVIITDSVSFNSQFEDSFINNGLFLKTGDGQATVTAPFSNTGTIDIKGTLNWQGDFLPGITSVLHIRSNSNMKYGMLNVSGQAVLNGKMIISPASITSVGDTVTILTAHNGVAGTFYSVSRSIDSLGFQTTYSPKSIIITAIKKNQQSKLYSLTPDTIIIAGVRTIALHGNSMTNVDSVVLYRVSSNRIITGQIIQKNNSFISLSLDLSDSVALGTQDLLIYRNDKPAPDTVQIALAPFISVPEFNREGFSGIAVQPDFVYGWSIMDIRSISNDESYSMVSVSVPSNASFDMRVSDTYHGHGDTLWTLSEDGADQGEFITKTPANGTSYLYYSLRINPSQVAPLSAGINTTTINKITANDGKVPFGSQFAISYKGSMRTSKSQFQDVITQALEGSNNAELTNYLFSIPDWESKIPLAVSQTLSGLSSDRVYTRDEIMQKVIQNLSSYKTPPADLYNNAKQDFNNGMKTWFGRKEQQYVDKVRKEVKNKKDAKDITINETDNIFDIARKEKNIDQNAINNDITTTEDEIFNQPPGTPVTDKERVYFYKLVGPWDPNDKTTNTLYSGVVQQDSNGHPFYSLYYIPIQKEADSIQYVVSFENEANATSAAHNVIITDTLDPNVDPSSIQILNTSYDSVFTWSRLGRVVTFRFTGINLPPNQNPPEGEGYVTYSVLPNPSLSSGTLIKNRASIVFDSNPPILTPTVVHEIHQVGDASVEIVNIPDSVIVNNDYVIDASVNNMGPDAADSVVLTYTIPANTTVKSVSLSSGSWKIVGNTITMTIGKLDAGQLDPLTLKLNTTKTGDESNNFSLTTSTSDANPLNNSVSGNVTVALTVLGVKSENSIPNNYNLSYNYPNPFNPTTTVRFSLPKAGITTLQIYNILGQRVASILNKYLRAGRYSVHIDASRWASGVYFYRIRSGNFSKVRKMMLLK